MADQRPVPPQPQVTPVAPVVAAATPTEQLLAQALAKITELMERQTATQEFSAKHAPKARKTLAQYLIEKPRKRLHREAYVNGRPVMPRNLSQTTIDLLDTIATGVYTKGTVTVSVKRIDDGDKRYARIHLFKNDKSLEQRMMYYSAFPTFSAVVQFIHETMKANDVAPVNDPRPDPEVEEIVEVNL
jgi:hypothetical protein